MQLRFKRRNGWRNLEHFRTAFSLLFLPKEMFGTKYIQTEVIKEENQGLFPPSSPPIRPPYRTGGGARDKLLLLLVAAIRMRQGRTHKLFLWLWCGVHRVVRTYGGNDFWFPPVVISTISRETIY